LKTHRHLRRLAIAFGVAVVLYTFVGFLLVPKNALGMLKDVPDAEMERLLLSTITVNGDDLRLLARRRAQVAR
jgi:hypothetical protein